MFLSTLLYLLAWSLSANAAAIARDSSPFVSLSYGSLKGISTAGVDQFLGIDYAQPPVNDLRFRRPLPVKSFNGVKDATVFGDSCLQQYYTLPGIKDLNYTALQTFVSKTNHSEDCLHLNVFKPTKISPDEKLPVVVYIHGGAFMTGDSSSYNATNLVTRSIALGEPVIYVSINYRLNAFGFLGGQEVMEFKLANLGIWDQILALEWIQKHISKFGGDPSKVTLWGQSAGGSSTTTHLVLNGNNRRPPFRAAVIHSSFAPPMQATNSEKNQNYYDHLVQGTNCSAAKSTMECLRKVPADALLKVIDTTPAMFSPEGLIFTWGQSVDNVLFKKTSKQLIREGNYAKVPVLAGSTDDEGTLFSLYSQNITTHGNFTSFVGEQYLDGAQASDIESIYTAYTEDPALGSPFNTGNASQLTSQFKRLSAFHGDWNFHSARRESMHYFQQTQNVWNYLWKRRKELSYLGSVHGGELPEFYSTVSTDFVATDALINFVNNLDPNYPKHSKPSAQSALSSIRWPKYNKGLEMLQISDNASEAYSTVADTFRKAGIEAIINVHNHLGL